MSCNWDDDVSGCHVFLLLFRAEHDPVAISDVLLQSTGGFLVPLTSWSDFRHLLCVVLHFTMTCYLSMVTKHEECMDSSKPGCCTSTKVQSLHYLNCNDNAHKISIDQLKAFGYLDNFSLLLISLNIMISKIVRYK